MTDHCNYGFDFRTIVIYNQLNKKYIQAHEIAGKNELYDGNKGGLFKLRDEIPADFGGFGPSIDKNLF